jgi:Pectate lyase superfamily protein
VTSRFLTVFTVLLVPLASKYSIQARDRVADVRMFGAKGDGVTDDTDAIERASKVIAQEGGILSFPLGTYIFDPHRSIIHIGSNMTLTGPGTIKVKDDAGDYRYIIGPSDPRHPVHNVVLDGLRVDQNAAANGSATISDAGNSTAQYVFLSWAVQGLTIRNCFFEASGVNTIVANGSTVEDALFENNTFVFHRRSGQRPFDNSAIYFLGKSGTAVHNHCRAEIRSSAVTCIETHEGNISVRDNVIEGYLIGMNIVDPVRAEITNNRGTAIENGVFIWATPGHVARNVTVTGNSFWIDNVDRRAPESAGIAIYYGYQVTGIAKDITIRHNRLIFQPETKPRAVEHPRSNWGISTQAFGPVENVVIADNFIENAPVRGIKIGERIDFPLSEPPQSNIVVEENTIVNAGYNSDKTVSPYRAAVAAEGNLRHIVIRNNIITESAVTPGVFSVWMPKRSGPYLDIQCFGQTIEPANISELIPPEVIRTEKHIQNPLSAVK